MSELTREQVEMEIMQLLNGTGVGGNLLACYQAQRTRIEQLEKDLNHQTRQRAYAIEETFSLKQQLTAMTAERDRAIQEFKMTFLNLCEVEKANANLVAERDRLKAAAETAASMAGERWLEAQLLLAAALRGE